MESLKRGGIQKEYEKTSTTFTKKGMWPERYRNETNGLSLAIKHGIIVPKILNHSLTDTGGVVTMKRIYRPRVDQDVWGNPQPKLFEKIGSVLASIHGIPAQGDFSLALLKRRFQDLQADVLHLSTLRFAIVNAAASVIKTVTQKITEQAKPTFIHGDYTIQNMFNSDELVIFDWEHSGIGSNLYDIGISLSFMILLVTDGAWTFADYNQAIKCFLDGYTAHRKLTAEDLRVIDALRFLGHRQTAQYYLFALEYFAVIEQYGVIKEILNTQTKLKPEVLFKKLCDLEIYFDKTWFYKIIPAIQQGGYKVSEGFWEWFKEEMSKSEGDEN